MNDEASPVGGSTDIPERTQTVPDVESVGSPMLPSKRAKRTGIPKLRKWSIVLIEWLDAVSFDGGMHSETSRFELPTRKSVGHFIRRSKEGLVLAMEDDRGVSGDASDCDSVTAIPLGLIRKVTVYVPRD